MKAALVGVSGGDRLYYIVDAEPGEKDGVIERDDGSTVMVNFMSYALKARNLNKMMTTRFHELLWGGPSESNKEIWEQVFVEKSQEIPKEALEGVTVHTSLGKKRKAISQKNEDAQRFIKSLSNISVKSCCGEQMVKSIEHKSMRFSSSSERKDAWTAMVILKQIEG
jgi:hypothetical protein